MTALREAVTRLYEKYGLETDSRDDLSRLYSIYLPLKGALAVLSGVGVPNVFVSHCVYIQMLDLADLKNSQADVE